jgi:hypothetical protein
MYIDDGFFMIGQESPGECDLDLYPEGCDDCAKQSIINLFDITKNEVLACHKREYVKLVCKEAALKREFPSEVSTVSKFIHLRNKSNFTKDIQVSDEKSSLQNLHPSKSLYKLSWGKTLSFY